MKNIQRIYFTKEEIRELKIKRLKSGDIIMVDGELCNLVEIFNMSSGKYYHIKTGDYDYMVQENDIELFD